MSKKKMEDGNPYTILGKIHELKSEGYEEWIYGPMKPGQYKAVQTVNSFYVEWITQS